MVAEMERTTIHTASGQITPTAPFSFEHSLRFVGGFAPTMGEQAVTSGMLTKAVMVHKQPVVFQVRQLDTSSEPTLEYTIYAEGPLGKELEEAALSRLRFYLSLDDDLRTFYSLAEDDAPFSRVVDALYGFHQVKFLTPFENACWAVLTQRMAIPVARSMKQRLVERFGGSIEVDGVRYSAFPEAEQLNQAGEDELAALIGNNQKASYLAAVACAFAGIDEAWLRTGDYGQVAAWMRDIRGIGEWSAHFVLIRGLGRTEGAPVVEKHLLAAVSQVYDVPATDKAVAQLALRYGAWQGYWMLYLRTIAGR